MPVLAPIHFGVLAVDGLLSRVDGALLLIGYACAVGYLIRLSRKGTDIEAATNPREAETENRWKAAGIFFFSLAAIVLGAELLVEGSETIIERLDVSDTFFGMVILALVVSVEEVARELPAAMKGHPEIPFGNIVGSALAFFYSMAVSLHSYVPSTLEGRPSGFIFRSALQQSYLSYC